jgi:N,N-dimethylformamidase
MSGEVLLAAYTDRLSGRPGDTIKFHVSSQKKSEVTARLVRSICCDPNPKGPGVIETDASEWFPKQSFPVRRQPIVSGSFAKSQSNLKFNPEHLSVHVEIWIYPTLLPYEKDQYVWAWGELGLFLNPEGCIVASFPTTKESVDSLNPTPIISTDANPLKPHKWYHVALTVDATNTCTLAVQTENAEEFLKESKYLPLNFLRPIDATFWLALGGSFNGKLESPLVKVDGNHVLAHWDLSQGMSELFVPCASEEGPPLELCNHPTRGVKGRNWDGTEFCWKHEPSHYAAIYFHDDDCYDFGWKSDFEWTLPEGIPSGIYIVRLRSRGGNEEALPLFICPPLADELTEKKVCVLVSTFTYVMYGNHARADFEESWVDKAREWKAYPHNPAMYTKYGLSTYNHHNDGTGICFASHRRPLFNLRPQYLTFGNTTCSGLRHFPADSHLIAWLHHHNIAYDIVTDHELHNDGVMAIANYQTIVTGSHPEYHTLESLNALQFFRDTFGGNIAYLGGDGFYWRVAAHDSDADILEIRRAEGGVRTWAAETGEYYHAIDGCSHGGLWRNNNRAPQKLVGVGFTAQGTFAGMPYRRAYFDSKLSWIFKGVDDSKFTLGDFGYSGNGAAGFELDRVDQRLEGGDNDIVILAQAVDSEKTFMLVPEDVLTTYANLSGVKEDEARRADMVYFQTDSGAQVFSAGSITFCGALPWNKFDNEISKILLNVIERFSSD